MLGTKTDSSYELLRVFKKFSKLDNNHHLIGCKENIMAMVASEVFGSFGNGSDFDLNGLDALITELRAMAKDKRAEMKDVLKAQKNAEKENKSEVGKTYKKAKSDDNKNHIYDLLQEVLLNSIEVVVVK